MKVWGIYSNKLEQYVHTGRLNKKSLAITQLKEIEQTAKLRGKDISDYEIRVYNLEIRG